MLLTTASAWSLGTTLPSWASTATAVTATTANAVVDAHYTGTPGALLAGKPTWNTIQAALDAAPSQASVPWIVWIRPGVYREKLHITRAHVHLAGENRQSTVLVYNAYSGLAKPSGGTWTTFGCATLLVQAPHFTATNMTVANDYDFPSNDKKDRKDPSYQRDPQAVALMTDKGADCSLFANLTITGYQDTLFTEAGRSYFDQCSISGHIDFIFGAGQSFFNACDIITRPRYPKPSIVGYVTAPSTSIEQAYGLVFYRCKLLKESNDVGHASSPLGRPWHPTRTFADGRYADPNAIGSSVFIECFMDDHITANGWDSMTGTPKTGTERTVFRPEDSRFYEYHNTGPGAQSSPRRRQLDASQASQYSAEKVLAGWSF
ncbi:hypothetical protein KIK84_01735 [Curvibacter sp. CHRR-16]|uniref:pectinesterase family protein n=1 Tax=Curvibacter sp. CHRR-16 TaxID=2835872 RepID=UPI001BDAA476|nr:pectinesterase family protein [Curvibacter sp. CHRR-16]MBT0569037.1 hypothetical protein [Curvibacter sp. CHRR-16]